MYMLTSDIEVNVYYSRAKALRLRNVLDVILFCRSSFESEICLYLNGISMTLQLYYIVLVGI